MKREYSVGDLAVQVSLNVAVGTPGLACTTVQKRSSGGQFTSLCQSTENSGCIAKTAIGTNTDLPGSYILITTTVDFGAIPEPSWAGAGSSLSINYHFSGGHGGDQVFNFDNDDKVVSSNKQIVVIMKPVKMVN